MSSNIKNVLKNILVESSRFWFLEEFILRHVLRPPVINKFPSFWNKFKLHGFRRATGCYILWMFNDICRHVYNVLESGPRRSIWLNNNILHKRCNFFNFFSLKIWNIHTLHNIPYCAMKTQSTRAHTRLLLIKGRIMRMCT